MTLVDDPSWWPQLMTQVDDLVEDIADEDTKSILTDDADKDIQSNIYDDACGGQISY